LNALIDTGYYISYSGSLISNTPDGDYENTILVGFFICNDQFCKTCDLNELNTEAGGICSECIDGYTFDSSNWCVAIEVV